MGRNDVRITRRVLGHPLIRSLILFHRSFTRFHAPSNVVHIYELAASISYSLNPMCRPISYNLSIRRINGKSGNDFQGIQKPGKTDIGEALPGCLEPRFQRGNESEHAGGSSAPQVLRDPPSSWRSTIASTGANNSKLNSQLYKNVLKNVSLQI